MPKTNSLLDCFTEMDIDCAVLTETWLQDRQVESLREDLTLGSGLNILTRNRRPAENGVAYGGVAVVWREELGSFRLLEFKNPECYEVLVAVGSLRGHSRKLVVLACYVPPGYNRFRGASALEYIEGLVIQVKRRYEDPYVVLAGDFNQWKVEDNLANFADIREVEVGKTRGNRAIDRIFTNMSRSVVHSGTVAPLETEEIDGETRRSDHKIAFCNMSLTRREAFKWQTYTYRHFNDKSVEAFRDWVVMHDWQEVLAAQGSDAKAEAYQSTVVGAVESCLLYTSPSPRDRQKSRMPSSA